MKKTFLLRHSRPWVYLLMGVYFLISATRLYFKSETSTVDFWMMILGAGAGLFVISYFLFVLTDIAGTAPKVVVYNEGLLLKSKAFSGGKNLTWGEIKDIRFHNYQIDLKLETAPLFFSYRSSAKTSRELKDAIRDMADMKGISVSGG